ncbi:LmbE family N-acetylglucosaminyl deacetylase [Ulvibacter sp. MAR_2010_11]|uniref:PIG-L family deacetylase n=1 Tax=Ulvibacter sp. MAR_2010_11 TaxID=1250229 RepID=UPI000C2B965B|nr:PIG-L family deacetylase [Ulvibacter sp. MAR_2010_11]PKA83997.1 LmbE family N-acetylglucosaminyl deacetylase [Ulvibacter sp. MAR_2010_11]
MRKFLVPLFLLLFCFSTINAQSPQKPSASEIYHSLQKLNFLGSALYIAAHPDDENTRLISFLSNDVKARTAYLSLTRGDGGQNLVGPEIRELLGVIRTQELLAARRVDGGQQIFTRANDFGYSKHPDETLEIWNKNEVLGDVVLAIRKFKPDIIINRFDHRSPGSTHGHHTSSAMLSFDAFDMVGDTTKYPETVKTYGAWQPRRLFFNTSWWFYGSQENFDKADKTNLVEVETGSYYPSLGLSNGEIASLSRSMHKSQGFGSTGTRGSQTEYLEFLTGDFPADKSNLFDGINTTWSRLEGGAAIGTILAKVEKDFNFKNPSASISELLKAYDLIRKLPEGYWKTVKMEEIKDLIADCAGLYLEAVANEQSISPKGAVKVTIEAINRSNVPIKLNSVASSVIVFPASLQATTLTQNTPYTLESVDGTFSATKYSAPYWLSETGTLGMYRVDDTNLIGLPEQTNQFPVTFHLTIEGRQISFDRNIVYKFNDPVDGEVYRPFEVIPDVTSSIPEKVLIFATEASREIPVIVQSGRDNINGTVTLQHPKGWVVSPAQHVFNIAKKGQQQTLVFTVQPPKEQNDGYFKPLLQIGDVFYNKELVTIDYDHIPFQSVLLPSEARVVRLDIQKKGQQIGYINGAGDAIPESLKEIGYTVTTIEPSQITSENLQQFDAIVVGIRAYNTVPELDYKQTELNNYVQNGGTLLLQYNTSRGMNDTDFGPLSLKLSRDRVTDENSEVEILAPDHPVLNTPNKITQDDFKNWVQERGLYFPDEWAAEFTPILGMHDKGEPLTKGSLLVAKYGKGHYIYTGLSFFRELPAGVPGAYRLFANLLSLGN